MPVMLTALTREITFSTTAQPRSYDSTIGVMWSHKMSSMFRNMGSALTFGAMETTKAKEARENYIERYGRHEERFERYKELADETFIRLEELWREAQRGRQVIVDTGALFVDDQGNLQPGWYTVEGPHAEGSPRADAGGGGATGGFLGGAGMVASGVGAPSGEWIAVGTLGTASTGAAVGGRSGAASRTAAWLGGGATAAGGRGVAAAPFSLTGIGLLAATPVLGTDFWRSRQRERERLEAIQTEMEKIEEREAEMQDHRSRLESVLPEISPAIDELASSATDAKTANDSRLVKIAEMRATLSAQCAKVSEVLQETSNAIENARGSREDLRVISDRSRDVTSAAAELQTESNRQETAVNEETNRTTAVLNKLAAAIQTADSLISTARPGGSHSAERD